VTLAQDSANTIAGTQIRRQKLTCNCTGITGSTFSKAHDSNKRMDDKHSKEEKLIKASPADHLANERTFLAWIRTSIAIMGFGFVLVKFSFFVRALSAALDEKVVLHEKIYSSVTGVGLVVIGALMALLAFMRYRNIEKHLLQGTYFPSFLLSFFMTAAIVMISLLLLWYLWPGL
jgi:putative membrane protein